MDRSLVVGPAHFLGLLGSHLFTLFFLSSNNAQRRGGKVLRAHDSIRRSLRKEGRGRK